MSSVPPEYPQGQPGGPYQQMPLQAPPAKRRKRWLTPLIAALAFLFGYAVHNGGGGSAPVAAAPAATVTQAGTTATVTTAGKAGATVTEKAAPAATVTNKAKPAATVTVTEQAPAPEQQKPEPTTTQPEPETTKNALTAEQRNAIESAKSYLKSSAFSRKGLIEQLSSDAGEGYAKKDATFAVDSLDVDYNAEAAEAAKSYLESSAFSRKGLIEQLSSDAGEGFTRKQAEYGVKQAGL